MPDTGTPTESQVVRCSDRALLLIVTEEDGDQNYYLKFEQHFSWPGGRSGPTVGVGYDCGYSTSQQIIEDWKPFLGGTENNMVVALASAAGMTGGVAQQFVRQHQFEVTITWDEALAQFREHELPKWEQITRQHLPNTEMLSGDSFGALVSLTYNRGPSFELPGSRYMEMRSIHSLMLAKAFDLIPNQFLEMRRLWPIGGDLWRRRGHEALLFRDGLHGLHVGSPPPTSKTPSAGPAVAVQQPIAYGGG